MPTGMAGWIRRGDAEAVVVELLREMAPMTRDYPNMERWRVEEILRFLELIGKTFPEIRMRRDAKEVSKELELAMRDRSNMHVDEWKTILDQKESFREDKKKYKHCKQYSCGLWQLFHILSLSADREFLDERGVRIASARASEVMDFTRFVVDNFFQCEECHREFLTMFDNKEHDRPVVHVTRDKVAMWLWRVHNAVTARLAKDKPNVDPVWPPTSRISATQTRSALVANYWSDMWLEERLMVDSPSAGLRGGNMFNFAPPDQGRGQLDSKDDDGSQNTLLIVFVVIISVCFLALVATAIYKSMIRSSQKTANQNLAYDLPTVANHHLPRKML
jgi:hypothetical protein